MQTEYNLTERLTESKIYAEYERAFSDGTGLPLGSFDGTLAIAASWPASGEPFCAMMAGKSRACAACLQVQQTLAEPFARLPAARTLISQAISEGWRDCIHERCLALCVISDSIRRPPVENGNLKNLIVADDEGDWFLLRTALKKIGVSSPVPARLRCFGVHYRFFVDG